MALPNNTTIHVEIPIITFSFQLNRALGSNGFSFSYSYFLVIFLYLSETSDFTNIKQKFYANVTCTRSPRKNRE